MLSETPALRETSAIAIAARFPNTSSVPAATNGMLATFPGWRPMLFAWRKNAGVAISAIIKSKSIVENR